MRKNKTFAAFILTNGRADKVITYKTLRDCGYTGKIYIVIDDEDKTANQYRKIYGDDVVVFSKREYEGKFDIGDNFNHRKAVVFARNAIFDIAKSLNIDYFVVLDDDYNNFSYTYDMEGNFKQRTIKNLDSVFDIMLDFLKNTNSLTIAMAQRGDFVGGKDNDIIRGEVLKRKAMNSFFCRTDKPFQFFGRINEDVNMYVTYGSRGEIILQPPQVALNQLTTQTNSGGLTDIYLDYGTYVKSFYSVLFCPSFVSVRLMGTAHKRLHHSIKWGNAVPKIIDESYKKK